MILLDAREDERPCHPPTNWAQLQASLKLLARAQALAWDRLSIHERQKYLTQAEQMESK
jgi:hypothetical protein